MINVDAPARPVLVVQIPDGEAEAIGILSHERGGPIEQKSQNRVDHGVERSPREGKVDDQRDHRVVGV